MVMERSIERVPPAVAQPAVAPSRRSSAASPRRGTALAELPDGLGLHQLVQTQGLDLRCDENAAAGQDDGLARVGVGDLARMPARRR